MTFLACIHTGLCQTVTNGSFDGTTTGWNNCGLGSDAVPEVTLPASGTLELKITAANPQ
jgi:hypothetical protein